MKILLAASEVAPIIKIGGLGDVIGSLPKALEKLGLECSVIVPYFPFVKIEDKAINKILEIQVPYAGESYTVEIYATLLPGSQVQVLLLKNEQFFHSHSATWKMSNEEEIGLFSFFDRAVVEYIKASMNLYDLVHCHDWHTGLITHLLQDELGKERPATLFTIHNLMYQGVGDTGIVRNVGIVPGEHMLIDWDVADGDVNMIQQGITSSDFVSTVSPTYMNEIQTKEFGGGLEDILLARQGRLAGILNGIDYSSWPRTYTENTCQEGKRDAKVSLQKKVGLKVGSDIPLFSFVGRLDPHQKGIDLVLDSVDEIVRQGAQLVILGSGDSVWESKFKAKVLSSEGLKASFSVNIMFDRVLAENIYQASDFLLVPSRYEPCGLIQLLAMWYGTLPVVRATGGLKDSVKDGYSGFIFENYTAADLNNAVTRALSSYKGQGHLPMIKNAMTQDFSWNRSAVLYKELYTKILSLRKDV